MKKFTYTIYDADPETSGSCHIPTRQNVDVMGVTHETVALFTLRRVKKELLACGQHNHGDRLWIIVWDDSHDVRTFSDTI